MRKAPSKCWICGCDRYDDDKLGEMGSGTDYARCFDCGEVWFSEFEHPWLDDCKHVGETIKAQRQRIAELEAVK